MKRNASVTAYIASVAPAAQRPVLKRLRAALRKALPMAEEAFESRMPVYKVAGEWKAGFAARARGPLLYVKDAALLDEFSGKIGRARAGRWSIEMRETKALPLAELESAAGDILRELGRRLAAPDQVST